MKTSLFIILLLFSITPIHHTEAFSNSVLIDALNKDRERQNLSILKENSILTLVAQTKADDMAQKGYFSHNSPDGIKPWYFFKLLGYKYTYAGENLAEGFKTATETEKAWIESSEHRTNILNPYFKDVGIGIAEGINGPIVVQEFGSL